MNNAVVNRPSECIEQSVSRFYRLLNISGYLVNLLKAYNISAVILKGPDLAGYYPVPEYREFGDVDLLLLDSKQLDAAVEILKQDGLTVNKRQDSRHHIEMTYEGKYAVELHSFPTRYFSEQKANKYIKDIFSISPDEVEYHKVCGVTLPVLPKALNGLYLVLHTLQHYLNAGFGVKFLKDFTMLFSDMNEEEVKKYKEYAKDLKISGFSDILTQTATELCGLSKEKALSLFIIGIPDKETVLRFKEDIIKSGTFGERETDIEGSPGRKACRRRFDMPKGDVVLGAAAGILAETDHCGVPIDEIAQLGELEIAVGIAAPAPVDAEETLRVIAVDDEGMALTVLVATGVQHRTSGVKLAAYRLEPGIGVGELIVSHRGRTVIFHVGLERRDDVLHI